MKNSNEVVPEEQKNGVIVLLVLALLLVGHIAFGLYRANLKLHQRIDAINEVHR